ncbi:hypothetical protein ACWCQS_21450 [Streptomyces sp. NPDC002076]
MAAAEQEWGIARRRVDTVLAPDDADTARAQAAVNPQNADAPPTARDAAKPKTLMPVWRQGLAWSVLSTDYQRILKALADRGRLGQGALACQEMAAAFGMDVVLARVEALRSKAKRLVARGWLAELAPGRFTLARDVAGPGGGS